MATVTLVNYSRSGQKKMITLRRIKFDPPTEPIDSRINAGILYLAESFIDAQTENGTPEERDAFVEELMEAMSKPLGKDAQAYVPIVRIGLPDD